MKLSIIVPIYNEEHNVRVLHEQIVKVMEENSYDFEIIFINDGSTDNSLEIMKGLRPLNIINFRKNFGQTAAMDAGFKIAKGDYLITLDGDLQNDPQDIPKMIKHLEDSDVDIVSGWRKNRKDSFSKRFVSRVANYLRGIMIVDGIHDSGCTLKVYKKECFNNLNLYGEMHRFIPALLQIKGFKVGEVVVAHRPRVADQTKYGFSRTVKGLLDMLSVGFWNKYSSRPLHLFGTFGFILMFISILAGIWAGYLKIFRDVDLSNTFLSELSLFGFLIGILFIVFGLLTDMLSKVYFSELKETPYNIKDVITNDRNE